MEVNTFQLYLEGTTIYCLGFVFGKYMQNKIKIKYFYKLLFLVQRILFLFENNENWKFYLVSFLS